MARTVAVVLSAVLAAVLLSSVPAHAQNVTDADILNFALNLECLEAEFYSYAAYGYGLSATDRGNGPASVGGQKALLSANAQAYAEQIAQDEIAHVRFLRAALGSAAVRCPMMDIGSAFATAADVALNTTLSPPFSPYDSDVVFYHGAFIFEDVGVTAYHGAAALISSKAYLTAAAGILATEAYHAGAIRTLLININDQYVFPYNATVATIVDAIAALRDALSGPPAVVDDAGILASQNTTAVNYYDVVLVPADSNAVVFSRTTSQVISIVTAGTGAGLFFPNGLNGNIVATLTSTSG